jgi:ACR3 family arsenite transporter
MYAIALLFFYVIYHSFIPRNLARQYLAGAVLLEAAPCTAMVFVWSHLTRGIPAYTLVQVATNDLIILAAFVPIVGLLLGISGITYPVDNALFISRALCRYSSWCRMVFTSNYYQKARFRLF